MPPPDERITLDDLDERYMRAQYASHSLNVRLFAFGTAVIVVILVFAVLKITMMTEACRASSCHLSAKRMYATSVEDLNLTFCVKFAILAFAALFVHELRLMRDLLCTETILGNMNRRDHLLQKITKNRRVFDAYEWAPLYVAAIAAVCALVFYVMFIQN